MKPFQLEFEIQGLPAMSNTTLRKHYWHVKREKDKWILLVSCAVGRNVPSDPLRRARIDYTRFSSKAPDYDGLVSGFKWCQDALVLCGIIKSDTVDVIESHYHWHKADQGKGRIMIKIEEMFHEEQELK